MNITSWDIYWIMRLDSIKDAAVAVSALSFIGIAILCAALFIFAANTYDYEESEKYFHLGKRCAFLFFIPVFLSVGNVFVPSTKEVCMVYTVPKLANSELVKTLQGDAKELYTLGIERLKAELAVNGEKNGTK